jgi:hypothetical protein
VADRDIHTIFHGFSERDKKKLVRACAREPCREALTTLFVQTWLEENQDRKLVACELLHAVKKDTEWLPSVLRGIVKRARASAVGGKGTYFVFAF